MTTPEERLRILKLIEDRRISAEEGARLLAALDKTGSHTSARSSGGPRWFRVRVTDLRTGSTKVNVSIPVGLVEVGMKMGARFAPSTDGIDMAQITRAIREGTQGKIMDLQNEEDAEHVEIYIE